MMMLRGIPTLHKALSPSFQYRVPLFRRHNTTPVSGGGSSKPMEGLLVVSFEQAVAAPYATSRMADAGARVLKVERSPDGDFARGYDKDVLGQSAYFVYLNRGKESVVLDIKDKTDSALLHRILSKTDIFVQNLLPGAVNRAGFSPTELRKKNPHLITCSISGYGNEGPYAGRKAYDLLVQAESGVCSITGTPEAPGRVGVAVADLATGLYAYTSVLEAVLARNRTGIGKEISISMFDMLSDWMGVFLLQYDYAGKNPVRVGLNHPFVHPYGAYRTKEGRMILFSIQNEREFVRFCTVVLERPELYKEVRFRDNVSRCAHRMELDDIISNVFVGIEYPTLVERMETAQVAYADVNSVADVAKHPVLRRSEVQTPAGKVSVVAPPVIVEGETVTLGAVPGLGEHTQKVRNEFDK